MIGNRIKLARTNRGRSQEWLAQEVGVRQTSVSAWERGTSDPTVDNMATVSRVLGVSFEWLAKGTGNIDDGLAGNGLKEPAYQYSTQSAEQQELLSLFDRLSKTKRDVLMTFVRNWGES